MAALSIIAPPAEAGSARLVDAGFTLPKPMPGETIRSFWERFHRLAPHATTKETLAALFGTGATQRFGHRLPPRITKLSRNVGSDHQLGDVRTIVHEHSILPYSCFFHTQSQTEQAYTALSQHRGAAAARAVTGDAIRDVRVDRPWPAFCPTCARADMEHGFTYWRVVHQLPTVVVCPEHGCRLREKRPPGKALDITLVSDFPPPDLFREDEKDFPLVGIDARIPASALQMFAKASSYMLARPTGFRGDFRSGMMLALREMGLRSKSGVDHAAVRKLIIDTHGGPTLEWLGMAEVLKPNGAKALRRMLGFRRERTDTERYLALTLAIRPDLASLEDEIESLRAHPGAHSNQFLPPWVTPMKYPGGKGKCYPRLINLMPPHTAYIESHLGGGAVMRHKRPAAINIGVDIDPVVISKWRGRRGAPCQIVECDAASYLSGYPFRGGELVYADPPYLTTTRRQPRVYRRDYALEDHEQLLAVLVSLPCNVMISGYDSDLYRTRLAGWRMTSFQSMTHTGLREEFVWMNFPEPPELHETTFLGDTFRDRQTVRRRHQRLFDRFDRMAPVERLSVLDTLNERFGRAAQ